MAGAEGRGPDASQKKRRLDELQPPGNSGELNLLLLLLLLLLRILLSQVCLGRVSRDARTRFLITRQERHERRNFERHLLARRKQRYGLSLYQLHMVVP